MQQSSPNQKILLTDVAQYRSAGIPWTTADQARWAYRKRKENGLARAFVLVNGRVAIDVPVFHQLVSRSVV